MVISPPHKSELPVTFLIVLFQVGSITAENKPFQSGSVFYEPAKLTSALYKHRVIFTVDGLITL